MAAAVVAAKKRHDVAQARYAYGDDDEFSGDHVVPEEAFANMLKAFKQGLEYRPPTPPKPTEVANAWTEDGEDGEAEGDKPEHTGPIPWILPYQQQMYYFYNSNTIQFLTAGLIFANFVVNAAEAQTKEGEGLDIYYGFEMFFTVIFTIELVVNYWAHAHCPFWTSAWNLFDFIVVAISLLSLGLSNLPGISTLRLARAFRVFRLFKRLESLRKIMACLALAIPGCTSAFAIVVLVTAIYAILCVQFFGDEWPYYFGSFSKAMYSLFQVMTGDSWNEAIARPIVDVYPHAAMLFISYILIVGIVLINVVVAVLLEKMTVDEDGEQEDPHTLQKHYILHLLTMLGKSMTKRLNEQETKINELHALLSGKPVAGAPAALGVQ